MLDRDDAITQIRAALKQRSGKTWSITGGKGTAWGWITVDAPPRRRTWQYVQTKTPESPRPGALYRGAMGVTPERRITDGDITDLDSDPWAREALEQGRSLIFTWEVEDPTEPFGHMSPADRKELADLMGLDHVHYQGLSIPAGSDFREEYLARAQGCEPAVYGSRDWD